MNSENINNKLKNIILYNKQLEEKCLEKSVENYELKSKLEILQKAYKIKSKDKTENYFSESSEKPDDDINYLTEKEQLEDSDIIYLNMNIEEQLDKLDKMELLQENEKINTTEFENLKRINTKYFYLHKKLFNLLSKKSKFNYHLIILYLL